LQAKRSREVMIREDTIFLFIVKLPPEHGLFQRLLRLFFSLYLFTEQAEDESQ